MTDSLSDNSTKTISVYLNTHNDDSSVHNSLSPISEDRSTDCESSSDSSDEGRCFS